MENNANETLFRTIKIGDSVKGTVHGADYAGTVTQMSDTRKPRGAGAEMYIFHVALSAPVEIYGVTRSEIRVRIGADESPNGEIMMQVA